jgi:hypothetical protein
MTTAAPPAPPKRIPPPPPPHVHPPGNAGARTTRKQIPALAIIAILVVIGLAAGLVAIFKPGPPIGDCPGTGACAPPEAVPLAAGVASPKNDLGFSFLYSAGNFYAPTTSADKRDITLTGKNNAGDQWVVRVTGVPATGNSPPDLVSKRKSELVAKYGSLEDDAASETHLVFPSIGHVAAVGGSYKTDVFANGPTGDIARIAIFAAGNTKIDLVVSVEVETSSSTFNDKADAAHCDGWIVVRCRRSTADLILDSMQWP